MHTKEDLRHQIGYGRLCDGAAAQFDDWMDDGLVNSQPDECLGGGSGGW